MENRLPGCYLLIILGEPLCGNHKERILQKVAKGKIPKLISFAKSSSKCRKKLIIYLN